MSEIRKPQLTVERVRELLDYDPDTGIFTWRENYFKSKIGESAGSVTCDGYVSIMINKVPYCAHRLAWLYVTGEWPANSIDHRNGKKTDNRFVNLRDVVEVVNSQNQRHPHADSVTGFLGVSRHGKYGFQARISVHGKTKFLGTHKTAQVAHEAYVAAKRVLHEGGTL